MPTTYEPAPEDVLEVVRDQLRKHHPDLVECNAEIGVIMASNESGPAVKLHGTPALAIVRVISGNKRVNNRCDAEIVIDAGRWRELHPAQQAALVDHECSHLSRKEYTTKKLAELRKEFPDHPAWKTDDSGRPYLGTVKADFQCGDAFASCIRRHGKSAVEFVSASDFKRFADAAMESHEAEREASA